MCSEDINSLQEKLQQLENDFRQGVINHLEYAKIKDIFFKIEELKKTIDAIVKRGMN